MAETIAPRRQELKKHVAAVWATGLPRNARLVWNYCLYKAYPKLPFDDEFSVTTAEVLDVLDSDSKNTTHLKQTLDFLVSTTVQWDIMGLSGEEIKWGTHGMLSGAEIEKGVITYRYDKRLREALYEPERWALIDLLVQVNLSGKYAVAIMEMIVHVYDFNEGISKCPWIELEKVHDLLGIEGGTYTEWRYFNRDVLKPALDQINSKTDFDVKLKRKGRPVSHIRFDINYTGSSQRIVENAKQKKAEQEKNAGEGKAEVGGTARNRPSYEGQQSSLFSGSSKFSEGVLDLLARLPEKVRKSVAEGAKERLELDIKRNDDLKKFWPVWQREGINNPSLNAAYRNRLETIMRERNLIPDA